MPEANIREASGLISDPKQPAVIIGEGGIMPKEADFEVVYANLAKISHVALEFLMDFKRLGPEHRDVESAPTQVRVIMNPVIAKAFRDALAENVRRYEEKFGPIPAPPQGSGPVVH